MAKVSQTMEDQFRELYRRYHQEADPKTQEALRREVDAFRPQLGYRGDVISHEVEVSLGLPGGHPKRVN